MHDLGVVSRMLQAIHARALGSTQERTTLPHSRIRNKARFQLHWFELEERAKGGLRLNQPSNRGEILDFILNDEKADL